MQIRARDLGFVVLMVVVWGGNFTVIKIGLRGLSPFTLGGLRFLLTAFPVVFFVPRPRVPWRLYLGFASIAFIAQFSLLFGAIKMGMPSGLASVLHQSQVLFTMLLAAFVLGERPTRPQILGALVAAIGLMWIGAEAGASFPLSAFILSLSASLAWAVGNLLSRSLSRYSGVNAFAFVIWSSLIATAPFFVLAVVFEGPPAVAASLRSMTLGSWLAVGYIAYGGTLGGYGLWNRLLKTYPAPSVVPFTLLVPVIGVLSGALVLGERLSGGQLSGSALVAIGLALPFARTQNVALKNQQVH